MDLSEILKGLDFPDDKEKLLVGFDTSDDAGVFRISEDTAIVQTVDFITPVVDDPYLFGQIAAANSMSDIFAMGATFLTALNLVTYDSCNLSTKIVNDILRGGLDKVKEAGGFILGGHTIDDIEMKFGLSCTGTINPNKILRNNTIKAGEKLILTKPIGSGTITTAIKRDIAETNIAKEAGFYMSYLNKSAAEIAIKHNANAATDITGFGLIGHLSEMLNEECSIYLDFNKLPLMTGARELGLKKIYPAGSFRNRDYYSQFVVNKDQIDIDVNLLMLAYDAQTSGGLVISIENSKADDLLGSLRSAGMEWAEIIGEVIPNNDNELGVSKGKIFI